MKKLIAFALVLVMLFSFTSCNLFWWESNGSDGAPTLNNGESETPNGGNSDTPSGGNNAPNSGESDNPSTGDNDAPSTDDNDTPSAEYTYTAFTPEEEQLYIDLFGEAIHFVPNNEYSVEEYSIPAEYSTTKGINLFIYGSTKEDFDAYRELYSYEEPYTFVSDADVTWYMYGSRDGSYVIEMAYYEFEGEYLLQVAAFCEVKGGTAGVTNGIPYDELFTNEGAGLPDDADGLYEIDFTKGEYVKDVTEQNTFLNGCPPVGSPGVLVIPVQFSDVTAESSGITIDTIAQALVKGGENDYYSLHDYYYISSYGKLSLDITILDFWFTPEHESTYYEQFSFMSGDEEVNRGEQLILAEALDYLDDFMDLSQFDSDRNGTIDSIILVNTLDVDYSIYYYWAFRSYNDFKDENGAFYEYDGVHAKDYIWLSYLFLHEKVDEKGDYYYDDKTVMDTFTFIHEFGHVLGLDDYYDYTGLSAPLCDIDIMGGVKLDQNAFSKFNLGWLTSSRLVVAEESITLTLEDYTKNGDTIIIANNWDDSLGAYQEYYILVYYTNKGLNAGDGSLYFPEDGIIVYHVNAALYIPEEGTTYDVYSTNTDVIHAEGTENNLIEFILSANGGIIYGVGDMMPDVTDDYGDALIYNFTVDELTEEYATITFFVQ